MEDSLSPYELRKRAEWKRKGVLSLVGGFFLMLYLGCFYLWGNISVYVISYFHQFNPGASYGFIFMVDALLVLFNWTGYQIGTYLF